VSNQSILGWVITVTSAWLLSPSRTLAQLVATGDPVGAAPPRRHEPQEAQDDRHQDRHPARLAVPGNGRAAVAPPPGLG
jgi:hypothetical protein